MNGEMESAATRLRDGLREERRIYEHIEEISRRHAEVLSRGESEELLRLARLKETELARIEGIEEHLAPLKEMWRERWRTELAAPIRKEVEEELAALETVLRQLIEWEASGQQGVELLRRETAERLRQVENGRRVQRAYGSPERQRRSRFVDRSQ